ncbi:MAG: LysE family translocator [Candidatus Tectimicrobiota bacterium]
MLTAGLVGVVVGFILAMPPGPIAFACLRYVLQGQGRAAVQLALGASALDIGYALLAAGVSSELVGVLQNLVTAHPWVLRAFQSGCIVLLVYLGVRYIHPTPSQVVATLEREEAQVARARRRGTTSPYWLGVLMALTNLANPAFLPALIFTSSLLQAHGWVVDDLRAHVLYAMGFGVGGALWFGLLLCLLRRVRTQLTPAAVPRLSRMAGAVLLLFAGVLTWQVITTW